MKNLNKNAFIFLLVIFSFCFITCDENDELKEPDIKEFTIQITLDWSNTNYPEETETYNLLVRDNRTACGKENLEELGILNKIKQAIVKGFIPEVPHISYKYAISYVLSIGASIIIENNTDYSIYKIIGDYKTLYLNSLNINKILDIYEIDAQNNNVIIMRKAFVEMNNGESLKYQ